MKTLRAALIAAAFLACATGIGHAQAIVTNTNPASQSGTISTTTGPNGGPYIAGMQGQTCMIDVVGAFTGSLSPQGSTSWGAAPVSPLGSTSTQTTITTSGIYTESIPFSQFRVVGPTSTGTVAVYLWCVLSVGSSGIINGTVSANQAGTWTVGQSGTWNVGQTGTWNFNCSSGCGNSTPYSTMYCTGTVGSHNIACTNPAGATVCVTNTGTDSCTVTGTSAYLGMQSASGSAETVTFGCFNTTNTTPATSAPQTLLDINLLGITQKTSPGYGSPLAASNITCQLVAGSGAINAGGILVEFK